MRKEKTIKPIMFFVITFFSFCAFGIFLRPLLPIPVSSTWAAPKQFLADKHKEIGIECQGCHQEKPPSKAVGTPACFSCHGDHAKVAAQTETVEPNPHASHEGYQSCEVCHHAHKPSTDHCGTCHNFGFQPP
jgi:hypothetical protein